jgi:hypothetical protein
VEFIVEDVVGQVAEAVVAVSQGFLHSVRSKPRGMEFVQQIVGAKANSVLFSVQIGVAVFGPRVSEGMFL